MSKWSGRTKGFVLGYKIFIFFIKNFGIRTAYFLLHFVVPFYYVFLYKAKKNLIRTFSNITILKKSNLSLLAYSNFYNLGKVLIDNCAILTKERAKYSYSQNGERYLLDLINNSKPAILISAHIGSWNIAGELLREKKGVVNVVMFDGEAKKIKQLIEEDIGKSNYNIIAIKEDLSHLFKIKEAIERKELICIHADRYLQKSNTIAVKFLCNDIKLPLGPFAVAAKLGVPYTFVFAVKKDLYKYHFTATKPKISDNPVVIANEFAEALSNKLSAYPEQWFNYFNIFET